ncbi:MAG: LytTR family DNA-binding domain-containing protein [Gallionella sp.]|nr:LytTR family DNA-binding domain-containing protein [Gallionella sp.]MDD4959204.1 LytTR family DNA-binding domain-containing protein [Gallionella sp.]
MKALIADDEKHLADDLKRRLARLWVELKIVAVVHDGISAEAALRELQPDIAFLDIRMPAKSGLEVAQSAPPHCRVVFVTAYDNHAVQAFEQAAVDYLLKPITDSRLSQCIARLQHAAPIVKPPEPLRWLRAQVGQTVRLVAIEDVCYFQSADKYTTVLTRDAELLLRTPLKDLIPQLDPHKFWQIHRSTVVNVREIAAARPNLMGRILLTLHHRPETLTVSRSYTHLFRER